MGNRPPNKVSLQGQDVTLNINFIEIDTSEGISDSEILKRIRDCSIGPFTKRFLIKQVNTTVGFMAIDLNPESSHFVLLEICIKKRLRHKGIGSQVLSSVEKNAFSLGYNKVVLYPKPFENDYPKEKLIEWYKSKGYNVASHCSQEFEKYLV